MNIYEDADLKLYYCFIVQQFDSIFCNMKITAFNNISILIFADFIGCVTQVCIIFLIDNFKKKINANKPL